MNRIQEIARGPTPESKGVKKDVATPQAWAIAPAGSRRSSTASYPQLPFDTSPREGYDPAALLEVFNRARGLRGVRDGDVQKRCIELGYGLFPTQSGGTVLANIVGLEKGPYGLHYIVMMPDDGRRCVWWAGVALRDSKATESTQRLISTPPGADSTVWHPATSPVATRISSLPTHVGDDLDPEARISSIPIQIVQHANSFLDSLEYATQQERRKLEENVLNLQGADDSVTRLRLRSAEHELARIHRGLAEAEARGEQRARQAEVPRDDSNSGLRTPDSQFEVIYMVTPHQESRRLAALPVTAQAARRRCCTIL